MMTLKIMIRRRKTSRHRLTKQMKRIHDNEKRRDETKKKKETIRVLEINKNRGENRRCHVELSKPLAPRRHGQQWKTRGKPQATHKVTEGGKVAGSAAPARYICNSLSGYGRLARSENGRPGVTFT